MAIKDTQSEYGAWKNAYHRCHNPSHKSYFNYGARGIHVAPEWRDDFQAFLSYIGPKPSPELTLERLDNDRGYEPGNVAWRSRSDQQRNRRCANPITIGGVTRSLREWEKISGVSAITIGSRRRLGVTGEALIAPLTGRYAVRQANKAAKG